MSPVFEAEIRPQQHQESNKKRKISPPRAQRVNKSGIETGLLQGNWKDLSDGSVWKASPVANYWNDIIYLDFFSTASLEDRVTVNILCCPQGSLRRSPDYELTLGSSKARDFIFFCRLSGKTWKTCE